MTQQDKELLLEDLCARLLYGVNGLAYIVGEPCNTNTNIVGIINKSIVTNYESPMPSLIDLDSKYITFKPYLRPMSSMTDDEMDRLFDILQIDKDGKDEDWIKINDVYGIKFFFPTGKWIEDVAEAYAYLYSIHIDFRGLIRKGLAIEAPEGMYDIIK